MILIYTRIRTHNHRLHIQRYYHYTKEDVCLDFGNIFYPFKNSVIYNGIISMKILE